jgi:hypothetical protein
MNGSIFISDSVIDISEANMLRDNTTKRNCISASRCHKIVEQFGCHVGHKTRHSLMKYAYSLPRYFTEMDTIFTLTNKYPHDYYVIITEGRRVASSSIQEQIVVGDNIAGLPAQKKQEVLVVKGRAKDEKQEMFIMYDIIRTRPKDATSKVLRFETFVDLTKDAGLDEIRPIVSVMDKFAWINRNYRPKLLLFDTEYLIPTLEDLDHCLPMLRFTDQERDLIAHNIHHNLPYVIKSIVKSNQKNSIRIIDAGGNKLSINALIENYYSGHAN